MRKKQFWLSLILCFFLTGAVIFVITPNYFINLFQKQFPGQVSPAEIETLFSPTSLASKDDSGVYDEKTGETELVEERTRSFKKFEKETEDGKKKYRVAGQIGPIHYRSDPFSKDEQYKEIDLTLLEHAPTKTEDWDYYLDQNGYQIKIWNKKKIDYDAYYVAHFTRAGQSIAMAPSTLMWENSAGQTQVTSTIVKDIVPEIDNDNYTITWRNAFGNGIDFRYNISPDKFFKTVIVNDKSNLPAPTIGVDGLKLTIVMGFSVSDVDAKNNFATVNKGKDLTTIYNPANPKNETIADPEAFSYVDSENRDLWWLKKPLAWDSAEEQNLFNMGWVLERSEDNNFMKLSTAIKDINDPDTIFPLYMDATIAEEQVGASSDDGFRSDSVWGVTYASLYIMGAGHTNVYQPMRFTTVPLPNGCTIDSAAVTYTADVNGSGTVPTFVMQGEAADDATTLSSQVDFDARTWLGTTVAWGITASWTKDAEYSSPDLSGILQDLVDRGGWASNNALMLSPYIATSSTPQRTIYAYDGSAAKAPKLNVSYTEAPSTITISGNAYTNEAKSTNIGASKTIGLSINGGAKTTVESTAGGAFEFTDQSVSADDTITLFIDDEVSLESTFVSQAIDDSTNITGVEMYTDKVVMSHETAGPMTNTLLGTADNSVDDDIHYSFSGLNLTFPAGYELWVEAIKTFNSSGGGFLAADDLDVNGALNTNAKQVNITGDIDFTSGNYSGAGEIEMQSTGSATITSAGESIATLEVAVGDNLTFADSATITSAMAVTTADNLIFNAGSTYAIADISVVAGLTSAWFKSSSAGNSYDFDVAAVAPTITDIHVQDSDASGGTEIDCTDDCINETGNTNWAFDETAPSNPTGFSATASNAKNDLSWTNPGDTDFEGIKIQRSTTGFPANEGVGTTVYNGVGTSYSDTSLTNGQIYYYSAFSYDNLDNYSAGTTATGTPVAPNNDDDDGDAGDGSVGGGTGADDDVIDFGSTAKSETASKERQAKRNELAEKLGTDGINIKVISGQEEFDLGIDDVGRIKSFPDSKLRITFPKDIFDGLDAEIDVISISIGQETYILNQSGSGDFTAVIITPEKGEHELNITIYYTDGSVEKITRELLIDPYGYVYRQTAGFLGLGETREERLPEATVSLYWLNDQAVWELWPAEKYNQENPQETDQTGEYSFMVPAGKYYVQSEKDGYNSYKSEEIEVIDTIVNLNIAMATPASSRSWIWVGLAIVVIGGGIFLIRK